MLTVWLARKVLPYAIPVGGWQAWDEDSEDEGEEDLNKGGDEDELDSSWAFDDAEGEDQEEQDTMDDSQENPETFYTGLLDNDIIHRVSI